MQYAKTLFFLVKKKCSNSFSTKLTETHKHKAKAGQLLPVTAIRDAVRLQLQCQRSAKYPNRLQTNKSTYVFVYMYIYMYIYIYMMVDIQLLQVSYGGAAKSFVR